MTIEEQKTMNENDNPHTQAVEILEQSIANGERFAYDMENPAVVMADLFRKEKREMPNPVKGLDMSLFPMKKEC